MCSPILVRASGSPPPYLRHTNKFFLPLVDALDEADFGAFGRGGGPRVPVFGLNWINFFGLVS
ncbi:hypothetical protein IMZ48_43525, partial [Candidatus Bathyarchaeota archaeon]|nr:hypothetical protein [Candidatus Bathyarchaeota archaeon]